MTRVTTRRVWAAAAVLAVAALTLGCSGLAAPDLLVEVEATAVID